MMTVSVNEQRVRHGMHALLFCLVMALGAYLRLHHLPDNPAWYTDETTHIDITRHLMQGEIRYFAVQDSWLLFSRLPLFEYILAGVFQIAGISMAALRTLTALCGLLTGLLIYVVLQQIQPDKWLSLLACGVWCVLPEAVLYNRFGFSRAIRPLLTRS